MLTKIFPTPQNTGHYFGKAKAQRAQVPLRNQLSFETRRTEERRQAGAAGGPSPQDELRLSQLLTPLAALLASSSVRWGMQLFPAKKEATSASPFDLLLLINW